MSDSPRQTVGEVFMAGEPDRRERRADVLKDPEARRLVLELEQRMKRDVLAALCGEPASVGR